jgi:hypothetical protein
VDEFAKEIKEISKILDGATLLDVVRREVRASVKDRFVVTGGKYHGNPNYDVIVSHSGNDDTNDMITRRLKASVEDIEVKKIEDIVDNVLGVRFARRGRLNDKL